jgi:catechol 2,3-dioxygenase-like lactoylglutathione lyase family enzyme
MAPDLECFDHVHIFVRDREVSERWYAEVMGLTRIPELEFWAAGSGPLTLTNPAGTIHLALFERPPQRELPARETHEHRRRGGACRLVEPRHPLVRLECRSQRADLRQTDRVTLEERRALRLPRRALENLARLTD